MGFYYHNEHSRIGDSFFFTNCETNPAAVYDILYKLVPDNNGNNNINPEDCHSFVEFIPAETCKAACTEHSKDFCDKTFQMSTSHVRQKVTSKTDVH